MKHNVKSIFVGLIVLALLFTGCNWISKLLGGINDQTNKVIQALDKGISTLNSQSANFQEVLNNILKDLPADASAIVRGDISNLLQRTVAAASSEVRCDVDFFRVRVQQELQLIKAKFLNTPIPPLEPHLCSVVPLAVDMSLNGDQRNKIEFYGYDFDKTKVDVVLVSGSTEINVSRFLDQPTHYHMTLNLGGSGVQVDKNSLRFILRWNSHDISTIAILQPAPKICQTEYREFTPGNITFIPSRVGKGDADFDGNGPSVNCSVNLINYSDRIMARVFMDARETQSDWTEAQGFRDFDIYHADPDKTIESIVSPMNASIHYVDTNHDSDLFGGNGCVSSFNFVGDTGGDEAGTRTNVTIVFNSIRVQLKEKGDCVSTQTLNILNMQKAISPQLLKQINTLENNPKNPMKILSK